MTALTLMIQGTSSSVGKSVIVTALCHILKNDGYKVAPFKAQNMALNSFVTKQGGEIGRAQACQAEAAGVEPSVLMNPVLLKPQADSTSQVVVLGKACGISHAQEYYRDNLKLLPVIKNSLEELSSQYDVIIIEGAGSPAEINLMNREIANMRIALMAKSPVLLAGDIDRGGVFASIVGTMSLLRPSQRRMVKGFIINKFRGDLSLLEPALAFLEKHFTRPVLGVIPYIRNIGIAQEDSVFLDERPEPDADGRANVYIIRLPHISNYDDFDPLEISCNVRYVTSGKELRTPDLIILPGTKSTIDDLQFLRQSGLADAIIHMVSTGTPVIGICGGYQMLGRKIIDRDHYESNIYEVEGLGLLDTDTIFEREKIIGQVTGTVISNQGIFHGLSGTSVTGYEIHMGKSLRAAMSPAFSINGKTGVCPDGAVNEAGNIFGTYLHGLFNNCEFTRGLLTNLSNLRSIAPPDFSALDRQQAYADLANTVRKSIDLKKIYEIIEGGADG